MFTSKIFHIFVLIQMNRSAMINSFEKGKHTADKSVPPNQLLLFKHFLFILKILLVTAIPLRYLVVRAECDLSPLVSYSYWKC